MMGCSLCGGKPDSKGRITHNLPACDGELVEVEDPEIEEIGITLNVLANESIRTKDGLK